MKIKSHQFDQYFLTSSKKSMESFAFAIECAKKVILGDFASLKKPYSGKTVAELRYLVGRFDLNSPTGEGIVDVIDKVGSLIVKNSINVNNPYSIAHLHCPPLIASLAAEMIISATNQSLDSWDQSPAATLVEEALVEWLCQKFNLGTRSDGIFTSGGTQSNFMGILLARDYAAKNLNKWDTPQKGLPRQAKDYRIICSSLAHFSVRQSARLLGLGDQAVIALRPDENKALSPNILSKEIRKLKKNGKLPIAIVATAGTTDFGSIDPLDDIAKIAKSEKLWLHIDAAVGGGLIFNYHEKHRLNGIEKANSLTVDFHKLFFQPISCGAFLVNDSSHFDLMRMNVEYLNPETNEVAGIPDLVTKSIQTTKRFDALKMLVCLTTYGSNAFTEIIVAITELAKVTGAMIAEADDFELFSSPSINSVVFRYLPRHGALSLKELNKTNEKVRRTLFEQGRAIVGSTVFEGKYLLKLTLMNPTATRSNISHLLNDIRRIGTELRNKKKPRQFYLDTNPKL